MRTIPSMREKKTVVEEASGTTAIMSIIREDNDGNVAIPNWNS